MVERLVLAVAAVILSGCGTAAAPQQPAPAARKQAAAVQPAAPLAPSQPAPSETVAADAYASPAEAVAAFAQAVTDDDAEEYRKAQSWLLLQNGTAIPALAEMVRDEQAPLVARTSGCKILTRLGPEAGAALLDLARAETSRVRQVAIEQLGKVRPVEQAVVARLIELTQGEDEEIRLSAIMGLQHVGPPAKDSVTVLQAIMNSTSEPESLRRAAASCLREVNPRRTFED